MKCNRDPVIRHFLACLGMGFNCSSKQDVQELLALNHNPARITYTHPYKTKAFLEYAALNNVKRLTVESIKEMILVREHHPKAELLLRLASFHVVLGKMQQSEFGLHPAKSLDFLLAAKASRLNVVGVAFHVEADGSDPTIFQEAMVRPVEDSGAVFQQATEVGFAMSLLDVGGGFRDQGFEKISLTLDHTLDKHCLTDCEILAEPGRFFVSSAVTKACQVIGKRYVPTPTVCLWDDIPRALIRLKHDVEYCQALLVKLTRTFPSSLADQSNFLYELLVVFNIWVLRTRQR